MHNISTAYTNQACPGFTVRTYLLATRGAFAEQQNSSFFQLYERVAGVGTGAALHHADAVPHARIPTFWSPKTDLPALLNLLWGSPINFLLLLVPVGFAAKSLGMSATWIFVLVRPALMPPLGCVLAHAFYSIFQSRNTGGL